STRKTSTPGFWPPVAQTTPDGDSAIRGGATPFSGCTVMVRDTIAPTLRRSTSPGNSLPVPPHPAAIITGVGSTRPAPRSTDSDRLTPATDAPPGIPLAAWAGGSGPP